MGEEEGGQVWEEGDGPLVLQDDDEGHQVAKELGEEMLFELQRREQEAWLG